MHRTIDINIIKENPGLFFKQLDQHAEQEFISLLEYFIFKYDIHLDNIKEDTNSSSQSKNDFLDFIENYKIKLPENFKFNREEANER